MLPFDMYLLQKSDMTGEQNRQGLHLSSKREYEFFKNRIFRNFLQSFLEYRRMFVKDVRDPYRINQPRAQGLCHIGTETRVRPNVTMAKGPLDEAVTE